MSSNFHRFVILCICWDTPSEIGLWQLLIVSSVFKLCIKKIFYHALRYCTLGGGGLGVFVPCHTRQFRGSSRKSQRRKRDSQLDHKTWFEKSLMCYQSCLVALHCSWLPPCCLPVKVASFDKALRFKLIFIFNDHLTRVHSRANFLAPTLHLLTLISTPPMHVSFLYQSNK